MPIKVATTLTATHGKSFALGCLNDVIETNRMPRKAIADEIGKSEQTFSKMTAGTQAFGLDDFEKLPREIQVGWLERYGREVGVHVRELKPVELTEEFLSLVDRLSTVARVARVVGRPDQMARAEMPERERKVG